MNWKQWIRYLWTTFLSWINPKPSIPPAPIPGETVNTLSQQQSHWHLMTILGTFDLFCNFLENNPGPNPQQAWVQQELNTIYTDLGVLKNSGILDANFQTIANNFYGYMPSFTDYRSKWQALLIDGSSFGGVTFGSWLNTNSTELEWSKNTKISAADKEALCFYTVLFFADLENLFIGNNSYVESYWLFAQPSMIITMASISAEFLVSYYYQSAGAANYKTVLGYVNNVLDYRNFQFGPYDQTFHPSYLLFFDTSFQTFRNESNTPAPVAECVNVHASLFASYSNPSTTMTQTSLADFGNYLDGTASVCRQMLTLQQLLFPITENDLPQLDACIAAATPICKDAGHAGTSPTTDSYATIVNNPISQDTTSPYWGFFNTSGWLTPIATPNAGIFHDAANLGHYIIEFTIPDPYGSSTPAVQGWLTGYSLSGYTAPLFNLTVPLPNNGIVQSLWNQSTDPSALIPGLQPSGNVTYSGQTYQVNLDNNNNVNIASTAMTVDQFPGAGVAWNTFTFQGITSLTQACTLYNKGTSASQSKGGKKAA